MLIHAIFVVFVAKMAQNFQFSVLFQHSYRWMADAVEHRCLYRGVMYHILENDMLTHLQLVVETPRAHEIAR